MELHQLRYLVAVIDEGTFTAAAHAIRVSQSGVSTQVRKLERELGVVLLDRTTRRVELTDEGRRLLPVVRAAIAAVDDIAATAGDLRGVLVGTVRVGTVTGLAWPALFDAVSAMHNEHPGVDVRLSEGVSAALLDRVRRGDLDVAVAAWAGEPPSGLRTATVVDDAVVAVVARTHPWARRGRVGAADLAHADLVTMPPGTGARDALEETVRAEGFEVSPRWEVATPGFVRMLTERGLGVGIVSAATAHGWDAVVAVSIDSENARSHLGYVWRDASSHATEALLRLLLER